MVSCRRRECQRNHLQEHEIDEIVYAEDREKSGKEKRMEFWSLVSKPIFNFRCLLNTE
jgi:hypothetical protein